MCKIYADLSEDIEDENEFCRQGLGKIRNYYISKTKTDFKEPPHIILMRRSMKLIHEGIKRLQPEDSPDNDVFEEMGLAYLLIGVGTEILLKAIVLKIIPQYFINNIKGNRTLTFTRCIHVLPCLLPPQASCEQMKRIKDILELIKLRRNNIVHLDLHEFDSYRVPHQIAKVLVFLYAYHFPAESEDIVKELRNFEQKFRVVEGIDYPPVEFDNLLDSVDKILIKQSRRL